MNEQQPTSPQQPTVTSTMTRITNVFMAPTELYTEIAATPAKTTSWLIPYIVMIFLAIVSVYAVYNNPSLRQQVFDMQEKSMQKMVTEGKVTQDQMDRQMDGMKNSGPVMFVVFGSGFQFVTISLLFFLGSLLLWISAKVIIKYSGPYSKILEVYGLASWISVLGTIITMILINLMNNLFATPGGGILLGDSFDPLNSGHKLLASLNIFTLWNMALIGLGLAKISGKSAGLGMAISFGLWAVFVVGLSMIF